MSLESGANYSKYEIQFIVFYFIHKKTVDSSKLQLVYKLRKWKLNNLIKKKNEIEMEKKLICWEKRRRNEIKQTDAKCFAFVKTFLILKQSFILDTNPDFQHHRIDYATDDSDKVEHVPRIFEKVLRSHGEKWD